MYEAAAAIECQLIEAGLSPDDAKSLAEQAKPSVWLETRKVADEEIAIGATKFGGLPDLPAGTAWPIRPVYPTRADRAESYRETATQPNSAWKWATPEQCEEIRQDNRARAAALEGLFPLSFLAQINFAQIWAAGPVDPDMPRSGLLSVFYDVIEQPWGYDPQERGGFSTLFNDAEDALERAHAPPEFGVLAKEALLPSMACEAHPCVTPLPRSTAAYEVLGLPQETGNSLHEWRWSDAADLSSSDDGVDWKCHHVGGWPTPIQGDMQMECALVSAGHYCGNSDAYRDLDLEPIRATATDWLLLAQFGTDEKGNLNWGDCGQLYLWIKRDDLRARLFERAHLVLQCY